MRAIFAPLCTAFLLILALTRPAISEEIVAQFSQNRVSITANFDGSQIVVYGAIKRDSPPPSDDPVHVVITLEGPSSPVIVRRKDQIMGVWANNEEIEVEQAPSFYAIMTTGALSQSVDDATDRLYRITIPRAIRSSAQAANKAIAEPFTDALIRVREAQGKYIQAEYGLRLLQKTLFQGQIELPANLVEGKYRVRIFITRDGQVIDSQISTIDVRRVGLQRWLYNLAHEEPLIYGLLALLIAIVAGWGASIISRYIRI